MRSSRIRRRPNMRKKDRRLSGSMCLSAAPGSGLVAGGIGAMATGVILPIQEPIGLLGVGTTAMAVPITHRDVGAADIASSTKPAHVR
jgi:hypothetical protein